MGNALVVNLVRQIEQRIRYYRCCNDFSLNLRSILFDKK